MADVILHIKDAYYFEVPKFLYRPSFESPEAAERALRFPLRSEPDEPYPTLAEIEQAMAGKILIPQLPGTRLKNLYEKESGFAISKFMVLEVVAALLLIALFVPLARRIKQGVAPKGHFWNLFEAMLLFIRDEVVRPAIGGGHDKGHGDGHGDSHKHGDAHGHDHLAASQGDLGAADHSHGAATHGHAAVAVARHDADRFLPLLWTMFFFVLFCNLLGLLPWSGSATGALATTGALALITFGSVVAAGMFQLGPLGFWKAQVPHMELPLILSVLLTPMIFAIEVLGLFIKHTILAVRLLANMMAGHLVLSVIIGFVAASAGSVAFWGVMPASVLGATALCLLELFVAFLQAYIFTFLSALFIGMAVHPH